ncbi:TPA: EpsG family protein [Photobacterium damselae]
MDRISRKRLIIDMLPIIYLPIGILTTFFFMIKPKKQSVIFISLFFSGLAYLIIPYEGWDLTRHYEAFNVISKLSIESVLDYGQIRYIPLHIYMWCLSAVGFNKEVLPAISVFLSYFIVFSVFVSIFNRNNNENTFEVFIILLAVWTLVPFIDIASSLRQHFSFIISFFGLWLLFVKDNKLGLIYLCLAVVIHISALALLLLYFIIKIKPSYKQKKIIAITMCFFIAFGVGDNIYFFIIDIFKSVLIEHGLYLKMYFDENMIASMNNSISLGDYILKFIISPMIFYIVSFTYAFTVSENECNSKFSNYIFYLLVVIFISSVSIDVFSRFSFVFSLIGLCYIMYYKYDYYSIKTKKIFLFSLLFSSVLIGVAKFNAYKLVMIPSWSQTFYIPSMYIPLESISSKEYIKVK